MIEKSVKTCVTAISLAPIQAQIVHKYPDVCYINVKDSNSIAKRNSLFCRPNFDYELRNDDIIHLGKISLKVLIGYDSEDQDEFYDVIPVTNDRVNEIQPNSDAFTFEDFVPATQVTQEMLVNPSPIKIDFDTSTLVVIEKDKYLDSVVQESVIESAKKSKLSPSLLNSNMIIPESPTCLNSSQIKSVPVSIPDLISDNSKVLHSETDQSIKIEDPNFSLDIIPQTQQDSNENIEINHFLNKSPVGSLTRDGSIPSLKSPINRIMSPSQVATPISRKSSASNSLISPTQKESSIVTYSPIINFSTTSAASVSNISASSRPNYPISFSPIITPSTETKKPATTPQRTPTSPTDRNQSQTIENKSNSSLPKSPCLDDFINSSTQVPNKKTVKFLSASPIKSNSSVADNEFIATSSQIPNKPTKLVKFLPASPIKPRPIEEPDTEVESIADSILETRKYSFRRHRESMFVRPPIKKKNQLPRRASLSDLNRAGEESPTKKGLLKSSFKDPNHFAIPSPQVLKKKKDLTQQSPSAMEQTKLDPVKILSPMDTKKKIEIQCSDSALADDLQNNTNFMPNSSIDLDNGDPKNGPVERDCVQLADPFKDYLEDESVSETYSDDMDQIHKKKNMFLLTPFIRPNKNRTTKLLRPKISVAKNKRKKSSISSANSTGTDTDTSDAVKKKKSKFESDFTLSSESDSEDGSLEKRKEIPPSKSSSKSKPENKKIKVKDNKDAKSEDEVTTRKSTRRGTRKPMKYYDDFSMDTESEYEDLNKFDEPNSPNKINISSDADIPESSPVKEKSEPSNKKTARRSGSEPMRNSPKKSSQSDSIEGKTKLRTSNSANRSPISSPKKSKKSYPIKSVQITLTKETRASRKSIFSKSTAKEKSPSNDKRTPSVGERRSSRKSASSTDKSATPKSSPKKISSKSPSKASKRLSPEEKRGNQRTSSSVEKSASPKSSPQKKSRSESVGTEPIKERKPLTRQSMINRPTTLATRRNTRTRVSLPQTLSKPMPNPAPETKEILIEETEENNSISAEFNAPSSPQKPIIMFSGSVSKKFNEGLKKINIKVTENPIEATHLILDQPRRTRKCLFARCRNIPVLNESWIDKLIKTNADIGSLLKSCHKKEFSLTDPEKIFGSSYPARVKTDVESLFNGFCFTYIQHPRLSPIQPTIEDFSQLIQYVGGRWIDAKSISAWKNDKILGNDSRLLIITNKEHLDQTVKDQDKRSARIPINLLKLIRQDSMLFIPVTGDKVITWLLSHHFPTLQEMRSDLPKFDF